jgi:hypothetical protein
MVGENPIEPLQNIQFLRGFRPRPVIKTAARNLKGGLAVLLAFQPVADGKNSRRPKLETGHSANDVNAAAFCFSRKIHPRRRALKCRLRVANRASITYRLLRVRGARSRQAGQLRETSSTCRDACRPKQFRARQRRCDGRGLSASGVDGQDPRRQ